MLFSIITPVYNTEKYISRCIESVIGQSFNDFEFILVDDGSTDCSGDICDNYMKNDSRLKVIHTINRGQGCARNIAMERAQGEYFVFVDSDDWIEAGLLNYLSIKIREHNNPEMIIYANQILNERNIRKKVQNVNTNTKERMLIGCDEIWKEHLIGNISGTAGYKCICRKVITDNKLEFPATRAREDAYFIVKLLYIINRVLLTNYVGYYQLLRYGSTEQSRITKDFMLTLNTLDMELDFVKECVPKLYGLALHKSICSRIILLQCIYADGMSRTFQEEIVNIKKILLDQYNQAKEIVDCEQEEKTINMILRQPLKWRIKCFKLGVSRNANRIKRFVYAQI